MFHTLAFAGAALDATAGNVQLNGVAEQLFQLNANRFRMPENYNIVSSYLGGANLLRGRIVLPHLRNRLFPQLYPLQVATVAVTRPPMMDFRNNPVKAFYDEDLEVQVTNSAAGDTVAILNITQDDLSNPITPLDLHWVRFTGTTTNTVLTWSAPAAITFEDSLESGNYGIYGLGVQSADSIAVRLIFNNQYLRPAVLSQATIGLIPSDLYDRKMGLFGTFRNTVPPQIEALGTAAGAEVNTGFMLISKIGN